jgi:hypothetical protein
MSPKARPKRQPADTSGDRVARVLGKNGDRKTLAWLAEKLTDDKQRGIILEAMFESMDVVDKLAFISKYGLPEHLEEASDE